MSNKKVYRVVESFLHGSTHYVAFGTSGYKATVKTKCTEDDFEKGKIKELIDRKLIQECKEYPVIGNDLKKKEAEKIVSDFEKETNDLRKKECEEILKLRKKGERQLVSKKEFISKSIYNERISHLSSLKKDLKAKIK